MKITCAPLLTILLAFAVNAETTNLRCIYKSYSNMQGNHKDSLELNFIIDNEAQESYLLGNNGSAKVVKINGAEGITFIEVTGAGNVMMTAITSESLDSVHSRHSILMGKMIPSQYYGRCEIRN